MCINVFVQRLEAGDLIFKLHMLATELPQGEENQYGKVKEKIAEKYAEIESQLVDAFIDAQRSLDTRRMRQFAQALTPFPRVSEWVQGHHLYYFPGVSEWYGVVVPDYL